PPHRDFFLGTARETPGNQAIVAALVTAGEIELSRDQTVRQDFSRCGMINGLGFLSQSAENPLAGPDVSLRLFSFCPNLMPKDQGRLCECEQKNQGNDHPDLERNPNRGWQVSPHHFIEDRQCQEEGGPTPSQCAPACL